MFRWLVVIMIVVPALEIWGLLTIGSLIGAWPTFGLILLTGFVGAFLARREARRVWRDAQLQLQSGQVPAMSIIDGLCIFAGGLLLLTPGFFTDTIGFILVFPVTRWTVRGWVLLLIRKLISKGQVQMIFRR